jgi:hypothetical protein
VIGDSTRAAVTLRARPLWRIRLTPELPRYLLCAMSIAGLAASARYAIAPPRPPTTRVPRLPDPRDPAAEGFAVLFARRYLTWSAADPQASAQLLGPYLGGATESVAGLQLPATGRQRVQWAEVVQIRAAPGRHIYTVAAQTDTAGLLYLTVGVTRTTDGSLALAGYPAFVGAPAATQAQSPTHLQEALDPALGNVVQRALRNYLAASAGELAADLTSGARVSLPAWPLALESMQHLHWSADRRSVLALVQAQDSRGVQYTLEYELDVALEQGRWEVSAVQANPTQ